MTDRISRELLETLLVATTAVLATLQNGSRPERSRRQVKITKKQELYSDSNEMLHGL
jgi:hypothetical protein